MIKPATLPKHLLSSSGLQNESLQNTEEADNQEMVLRAILLDYDEISMTITTNNVNEP